MTPTQQVTPLEQSKRLKELGVKQESLFEWAYYPSVRSQILSYRGSMLTPLGEPIAAAFTVAELGVMLPTHDECYLSEYDPTKTDGKSWYSICNTKIIYSDTEASVRAVMLIYLLENNLITVEEVNSRLAASPDPAHR